MTAKQLRGFKNGLFATRGSVAEMLEAADHSETILIGVLVNTLLETLAEGADREEEQTEARRLEDDPANVRAVRGWETV